MKFRLKGITNEKFTIIAFFLLFALILVIFQMLNQSFLNGSSIINMLKTTSTIAIAALGLTYVVILKRSDISFYMSACFSAMAMAWVISIGGHPLIAISLGLLSGLLWGAVSGIVVGKLKLPDIISTIAIGSIAYGAGYIFSDGAFIYKNFLESGISNLSEFRLMHIPLPVYIMFFLFFVSYLILEKTKLGRCFYAVGANEKAAYLSGVNVNNIIIMAFIISGILAATSTMISTAAQGNGNVKIGLNLLMPSFTSIYIGWSIFRKPCVLGTFLGALFTTVMRNGFIVISVPYYYADLIIAGTLILAILISKVEVSHIFTHGKKERREPHGKVVAK